MSSALIHQEKIEETEIISLPDLDSPIKFTRIPSNGARLEIKTDIIETVKR